MEKKISNIYKDAQKDISEKWDKFMKSHYPKLKDAQEKLKEAEKSGDKDKIKDARDVYERTAKNITVNNRRYQSMVNDVTNKLANTNQIALDYINGEMPSIYTINYNSFGDEKIKGYSFSLVNENAIRELATKDELLVPHKDLDIDKDKRWNAKNINSQVFQGILQGESIPKMAKRLRHVTDMNENSSIRNARTMTTSAENKGRQDSFKRAQKDGIIMVRKWVAAHDSRTRAWHSDLDGQEVGLDESWENDFGEIMYPGDPTADPANVYNCRCSIRSHILGFDWGKKDKSQQDENGLTLNERHALMSYKSFDFYGINNILRDTGMNGLTDDEKKQVVLLDQALKKLPRYSGNLSRSIYFDNQADFDDFIENAQENNEQEFKAFTSTTKSDELYNPEGQVQIFIEDASRGRDLKGYDNDEEEVLYERNAKFKIKKQYWINNTYIMILKEIIK